MSSKYISLTHAAVGTVLLVASIVPTSAEDTIPNVYTKTPLVAASAETLALWPRFTFLESLLALKNEELLVTDHLEGRIYHVTASGDISTLADIDGEFLCLDFAPPEIGGYFATAWKHAEPHNQGVLYHVSVDGKLKPLTVLPKEPFLNGIAGVGDGLYLMAGSATGTIWFYDSKTDETGIWFRDEALMGPNNIPGINGLRVMDNTVYFSNTGKGLVGSISLNLDRTANKLSILHQGVVIDDFAIARDGTIYGATHIFDSVVKVSPDGRQELIAGPEQGVQGSTSVIWARNDEASKTLLISTNGGINFGLVGKTKESVVKAKVVRLKLN